REPSPGARGARTAAACGPEGRCFAPVFVERRSSHSRGRVARCHRKGGRGALTTLSRDVSAGEARASFVRPGGRGPGCVRQGGGDEHGSCPRGAPEAARRVVRLSRPWRSGRARPPGDRHAGTEGVPGSRAAVTTGCISPGGPATRWVPWGPRCCTAPAG